MTLSAAGTDLLITGADLLGTGRADLLIRDGRFADVADAAADAANSLILDQVAAGVAVRMGVLYQLLGGEDAP